jgi:hypothetical protein
MTRSGRWIPGRALWALGSCLVLASVALPVLSAPSPGALSVRDFGAKGDGASDDTAAFQAALDEAGKTGTPVHAPAGRYRFAGHLKVPTGVTLVGTWQGPPSRETGTVLEPTEGRGQEDGTPFITLAGAAGVKGLVITYPQQVTVDPPPAPYPWTIRGLAQDCQVRDCLLVRPYQAIDFGTFPCSRHVIDGVFGSPLRRGIYIDGSIDVGRINNVHFSTFFFPFEGPLDRWKLEHAEAFIIGRADWEWITNCFAIGYNVGFRFFRGKGGEGKAAGVASYVAIAHSGIDLSGTPMVVEDCAGITVSQSVFKGRAIEVRDTNRMPVKFAECWFSPVPGTGSLVTAAGTGRVSFDDCTFEFWDTQGTSAPALLANCASVSVQGCEFGTHNRPSFMLGGKVKRQVHLGEAVASGVIRGNRLRYGEHITNASGGRVTIGDNVVDDVDAGPGG